VALKVLPEAFARDPGRMMRFQREAEVLASLNHPNIATIHGVEEHALVMELVEGESPKGPMSFEEAWKIALQNSGCAGIRPRKRHHSSRSEAREHKGYAGRCGEVA
jgi:serine/threonine protein kinase